MSVLGFVGRPAYHIYHWAWTGLDWLFPPKCGGCGCPGTRWCLDCQRSTQLISAPVCERCGEGHVKTSLCPDCCASPPRYTALRSWAVFDGSLRTALHKLKYGRDMALGEVLARPLTTQLMELKWAVDLVTPVPLGVARQAQRGYNQAALLAWPLALSSGIAYQPHALAKVRETRTQVGLSMVERKQNVTAAFQARPKIVANKRVLLVDDVTTSGATLNACAEALFQAGASLVYALTLARATQHSGVKPYPHLDSR